MKSDFSVISRKLFLGPNLDLDQQALVLDLQMENEIDLEKLWREVVERFPELAAAESPRAFPELFARAVIQVQQLGMNLFATKWAVREENGHHLVAIQYIDPRTVERCVDFVQDWLQDVLAGRPFRFKNRYDEITYGFYKSGFGGPTIYSIIEAGYRSRLPMFYLRSEDVFQWGQGRKQLRGRSTVLHRDSIKDTELTTYKDRAKEFLDDLGFPVPQGGIVYDESEAETAADTIGYPVVTKPVAGHKGQGVTTGIHNRHELKLGFDIARDASENKNDGIIVERQISGTDHRLLTVRGKFVAALQRIPAYVVGDGTHSIEELIEVENTRPERADTPRSPLGKIKIDENLVQFIREKGFSLRDVPPKDLTLVLRRVANISAGGVSVNVTGIIHPLNVKLAEDVAKFLNVHALGIDLLAEDISKPWTESPCAIIEINAGPGVFMHLVPAQGESINVPEMILKTYFPTPAAARIPTIVFNKLSQGTGEKLTRFALKEVGVEEVGVARQDGVFFNNAFFSNRPEHNANIRNLMRNTRLDMAILEYTEDQIRQEGLYHWGTDVAVLDAPTDTERRALVRDLLPGGLVIEIDRSKKQFQVSGNGGKPVRHQCTRSVDEALVKLLEPTLKKLIHLYNIENAVKD